MTKTASQMVPVLAILVLAAIAVADAPPKPTGQQIHLFEATVRVPDDGKVDDEYNYRLLATVLGSVEKARSVMYETCPGTFSALLTDNQARRLSRVPGVLEVRQRDDPVPTDGQ